MIIVRSPLRITLGGGGTDLPSYYRKHGGFVIAAAINKYVYITVYRRFVPSILLKYMQIEEVNGIDEIQHPIIREALRMVVKDASHLEIVSFADIPAGTGLGSSGSFTTALLMALNELQRNHLQPQQIAEQACHLEIDILGEPIGKQDQHIAVYGGVTCLKFNPNDEVEVFPLRISQDTLYNLEDNLLLFFTGQSRSASDILRDQNIKSQQNDREMMDNLHFVNELGLDVKKALEAGDLVRFAEQMNVHWENKKRRSEHMSSNWINECYELACKNGALGGKLIGAGGGGFLMFYAEDRVRLRKAMLEAGLHEVRFQFDFEGTKVVTWSGV